MSSDELRERGKLQEVDPASQTVKSDTNKEEVKSLANQQEPIQNMEYNVEMDPQYRCLFVTLKIIIGILLLISFGIIFANWIAPYLVSKSKKLEFLRQRLINHFCYQGECTDEDWETINAIMERASKAN